MTLTFFPVSQEHQALIQTWLQKPHVQEYYYGQGVQNTITDLDKHIQNPPGRFDHWIAYINGEPFGYLMTSLIVKPTDPFAIYSISNGTTISLDLLIGEEKYLGKGLAPTMIQEFLRSLPNISEVLIDPELRNTKAIRVYEKAGFTSVATFTPEWLPVPHLMMRLLIEKIEDLGSEDK